MPDLSAANLSGADLSKANLRGAYLNNANLQGADLTFSRWLTKEQIAKAKTDETTKLPDYLDF